MVTAIFDSLRWLGLDWDEGPGVSGPYGPYFQAERVTLHREAAPRLVASGAAYYCYCTPEELQAKRAAAEAAGGAFMYDRTCRALSAEEIATRLMPPAAARRALSACRTARRPLTTSCMAPFASAHADLDDFVILRSDGIPTYQLSAVVDDVDMAITHVVRGDDHISNTPKQVLLYRALGRAGAAVCARAAHPRPGQEAAEQAPRRDLGGRVRNAGLPA